MSMHRQSWQFPFFENSKEPKFHYDINKLMLNRFNQLGAHNRAAVLSPALDFLGTPIFLLFETSNPLASQHSYDSALC